MFTATNARIASIDSSTVETEIALLNLNILSAVNSGGVNVTVTRSTNTPLNGNVVVGTPMTLDPNYYNAWQTSVSNVLASGSMQSVLDNFARLGYTISRVSADGQHINWQISW